MPHIAGIHGGVTVASTASLAGQSPGEDSRWVGACCGPSEEPLGVRVASLAGLDRAMSPVRATLTTAGSIP